MPGFTRPEFKLVEKKLELSELRKMADNFAKAEN